MWPDPPPEVLARMHMTVGGNRAFHNFHNDFAHIIDPNERRRLALAEIDKVPFSWYHVRAVAVAGIGFFTDSYDIFAINLAIPMIGIAFWQDAVSKGAIPSSVQVAIKAATSGGTVLGMVAFGWLADLLGRRRMYGVELTIIILATFIQCLASSSRAVTFTGVFVFWRVIMGIGIGGDYPLSAVITSEFAPTKWRGAMMASVFSMQGLGQCSAAIVALITTAAYKDRFTGAANSSVCTGACQIAADQSWRIVIAIGGIPALCALYYRITIPETPRYTFDVARDMEKGGADIKAYIAGANEGHPDEITRQKEIQKDKSLLKQPRASLRDFQAYFSHWSNAKVLLSTTLSWLLLDLAFYGLGLNNSTVLSAIGYSTGPTLYSTLYHNAVGNLILVCAGSIPGYIASILLIDHLGRRPIQIAGFAILTILFCIIGFAYDHLSSGALLGLYILAQFFFNFGPNTTTFLVPGECFPTRYRAACHGLSAASGKIGAIIAQIIAQPLLMKDSPAQCVGRACTPWLPHLMEVFALFMLLGTLVSFGIPETKTLTLEELAGEEGVRGHAGGVTSPTWLSPALIPISPRSRAMRHSKRESDGFEMGDLDIGEGCEDGGGGWHKRGRGRYSNATDASDVGILRTVHGAGDGLGLRDVGGLLGGKRIQDHYL